MEYQFTRSVDGVPVANFNNESHLIGVWLTEEVGRSHKTLNALLHIIDELEHGTKKEYQFHTNELGLYLDRDEIELYLLSTHSDEPENASTDELPEGTAIDENAERTGCGLADFKRILLSWKDFIE